MLFERKTDSVRQAMKGSKRAALYSVALMMPILLLMAVFLASCPEKGGTGSATGKITPIKVLSGTYQAYVSKIKEGMEGVDIKSLTKPQQELALKLLNEIPCGCDCRKTTIAECRVKMPDCDKSKQQSDFIVERIKEGATEGQVVRGLYDLLLKDRIGGAATSLLNGITPNYTKQEMVDSLAKLLSIDTDALKKTGNELTDARTVAKSFLGQNAGLLKYLEGVPDELYIMHGVTYEMLGEIQKTMFEYYFFQNRPELQKQVFPYLNQGTAEGDMIIGISEGLFQEPPPKTGIKVDLTGSPTRGPANAPIVLVEFSDFQCPYCGRAQPTIQQFWDKYPGKVRHVFKNFPLGSHQQAEPAARAAMAAFKQGKFWEYRKLIFENQRNLNPQVLDQLAQQLGLNMEQFKSDMASPLAKSQIQKDMQDAAKAGVRSTPTFVLNGTEINGARNICSFIEATNVK